MFAQFSFQVDTTKILGVVLLGFSGWLLRMYGGTLLKQINFRGVVIGLAIASVLGLGGQQLNTLHSSYLFDAGYSGYLRAAYGADTPEAAQKYMDRAARWLDRHGVKDEGPEHTSVIYESPESNVRDWAAKFYAVRDRVEEASTNEVIRAEILKGGLLKVNGDERIAVVPPGIAMYPNNAADLIAQNSTSFLACVFGLASILCLRKKSVSYGKQMAQGQPVAQTQSAQGQPGAATPICSHCGKGQPT